MKRILITCSLILLPYAALPAQKEYQQVPFVIHAHSLYSQKDALSIDEIAQNARKKGIRAVIISDHDIMEWEYGIPPLRKVIKKKVSRPSVLAAGPEKYLKEISDVNKRYNDVFIIPGVESTPFYYWSGSVFKKDLTLNNGNKHIVVAGLYTPEQYRGLPVVGNERNAGKFKPYLLWPVFLVGLGALIARFKPVIASLLLGLGVVFLLNNFPFKALPYDQYHGNWMEKPYQYLTDYVQRVAPDTGMVFWAHPEAPNYAKKGKIGPVFVQTPYYSESLLATHNYTGFAYFQEGRKAGAPGGVWDRVLADYCSGKRKKPVWAVGELDYRKEGFLSTYIDSFKNVVLFDADSAVTPPTMINTIKSGRFYIVTKPHNGYEMVLNAFKIESSGIEATMGETLKAEEDYTIKVSITTSDRLPHKLRISVISDGKVSEICEAMSPCDLALRRVKHSSPSYCRLEITADNNSRLVTNPVFVE